MGDNSKIEWTDHTFNPWIGCQKVGPGCDFCYAEAFDKRFGGDHWGPKAERRRTSEKNWNEPGKWNRAAIKAGRSAHVFCASMADVFDKAVHEQWRRDLWGVIDDCSALDWQIVTKRVGNVDAMIPPHWRAKWPANVWLIITVVNQDEADRDVPKLLHLKAHFEIPIVGLSCEPLLGPIDLPLLPALDWIIVGGESGPNARPMHPDWARSIRDQCKAADVPFFFKQWGQWVPWEKKSERDWIAQNGQTASWPPDKHGDETVVTAQVGDKATAGRLLDGREHNEMPERANG